MHRVFYDNCIFSWQQYGGISRYIVELAKRVDAADGFQVSIIAPIHLNEHLRSSGLKVQGKYVPKIPRARVAVDALNWHIEKFLLRQAKPDLVHETYYQAISSAPKGCRIVITVHDMIHEKLSSHFDRADGLSAIKRAAVQRADRILCVSESTRQDLLEVFDTDPAIVKVIHHGFTVNASLEPKHLPASRPFFLYVGMRDGYKNFKQLVRAYASSGMLRREFDLVAFGANAFTPSEWETIRGLGLNDSQVRHVSGDDDALGALYRQASAFVYPSLYEGFGFPPLEAMGFECPVLCSDRSSIPEVVGDAGLYFDPYDCASMADAMERIVSDKELRREVIRRGVNRVKSFSWDRCAHETLAVYRELLE